MSFGSSIERHAQSKFTSVSVHHFFFCLNNFLLLWHFGLVHIFSSRQSVEIGFFFRVGHRTYWTNISLQYFNISYQRIICEEKKLWIFNFCFWNLWKLFLLKKCEKKEKWTVILWFMATKETFEFNDLNLICSLYFVLNTWDISWKLWNFQSKNHFKWHWWSVFRYRVLYFF